MHRKIHASHLNKQGDGTLKIRTVSFYQPKNRHLPTYNEWAIDFDVYAEQMGQ